MNSATIDVKTADGVADSYLARPDDGRPHPGVLFLVDAFGLRPQIEAMVDRIAAAGYVVLAPNVFYRDGRAAELAPEGDLREPRAREAFFESGVMDRVRALTPDLSGPDAETYVRTLLEHAGEGPIGVTGYCMGGGLALNAAGRFPDRVGAAASFHGGQIASTAPDSPHLLAASMQAKVYVAGAENDGSFDDEQFKRLDGALSEAGVDYELVTYPALHGFAVPDNPTYDEAAATRHWEALESLYADALSSA